VIGTRTRQGTSPGLGVRGNPLEQLKPLEYPDLVISGGVPVTAPGSDGE
jgi:hypothetical protein